MLHDIYMDALAKREGRLADISDSDLNRKILEKAKELWREYQPVARACSIGGVDSSYNRQQFQGFHLYVVDAVCITKDGSLLAKEFDHDIGPVDQSQLETKSMQMETNVAAAAAEDADLILLDGSMITRFVVADRTVLKSLAGLIEDHDNAVFVSKTSDSRDIFKSMHSRMGDIYFFNRIGRKAGYSRPHHVRHYAEPVTVVYARLSDYTPIIKLELPGEADERHVKEILDHMASESISGYPYTLKLAHKTALVSDSDIERLASIYGLKNEIGAREVLR